MKNDNIYSVRICENYVVRDAEKVKNILERVSKIITNTYKGAKK